MPFIFTVRVCWACHCLTGTTIATGLPWRVISLL
jgi:hypothetical protein